jgi:transcriptional regulator with XRE-family HTH domain
MRETLRLLRAKLERLSRKTFRDAYVRANVEQGIAHQIRILRQAKGWSQRKLAQRIRASGQSAVARLEDPSYGRFTLTTLLKLAAAFDVALLVKFVPYSKLLAETADLSPEALRAESFASECPKLSNWPAPEVSRQRSRWAAISGEPTMIFIDSSIDWSQTSGADLVAKIRSIGTPANVIISEKAGLTPTGESQWLQ